LSAADSGGDSLKFLGTAGARFAVSTQLRHSGGIVWRISGFTLWVDPGPGALVRALAARPRVDPRRVDGLLLSHRHLDHCGDATAVVEAMTEGGRSRRGALFAPRDALETEPVVFRYAQEFLARRIALEEKGDVELAKGLSLSTPLAHDHGIETFGYRLHSPALRIAHVTDTFWMDALPEAYAGVDLLVVNATRVRGGDRRLLHLGWDDAERLVKAVKPRAAILTHFGIPVIRGAPEDRAREITERIGIPVLSARDGMTVSLEDLAALRARAEEQGTHRERRTAR
jgi:phosphoribosyl 1,2-cyclic phosphodiesterase